MLLAKSPLCPLTCEYIGSICPLSSVCPSVLVVFCDFSVAFRTLDE